MFTVTISNQKLHQTEHKKVKYMTGVKTDTSITEDKSY